MTSGRHRASLHTLQVACVGLLVWIPFMTYLDLGRGSWPSTLAWVLLDVAELAALVTTARLLRHHDGRTAGVAMVSATLLVGDALIDVVTSAQGSPQLLALAAAALVEIPLALVCCSIAATIQPSGRAPGTARYRRARGSCLTQADTSSGAVVGIPYP